MNKKLIPTKIKRISIYTSVILFLTSCTGFNESKSKSIYVDDFNWTVEIPKNLGPISQDKWDKSLNVGQKGVEKTLGKDLINNGVTIFVYKNEEFNTYESNYQPFDTEIDGDYLENNNFTNSLAHQTFEAQLPNAKIDSTSSIQIIDGLEFYRFDINLDFPNGIKMKSISFSRLFDKKELTINITYIDEKIGEQMLESFKNSKFEN